MNKENIEVNVTDHTLTKTDYPKAKEIKSEG
jgi:hypothetical protein